MFKTMGMLVINGEKILKGEIEIKGSKNAATKMMIASLLTDEECILENFPNIGDVETTFEICRLIGSNIKTNGSTVCLKTSEVKNSKLLSLTKKNRIPILALGPLLARASEAEVPVPGGDKIGPRPVDIHLEALKLLGAQVEHAENSFKIKAPKGLKGAKVQLRYPSVG